MKTKEKKLARKFRKLGMSVGAIAVELKSSKSAVSRWVRDISLTEEQIDKLKSNQDRGRAKAANHPNSPKHVWGKIREKIIQAAIKEIPSDYSLNTLKIVGIALYWAEGTKARRNIVHFSNSDPHMISLMMRFFRKICKVPEFKFRGVIHIHPHLNRQKALKHWSKISGIPVKQFHKTQTGISKVSKNKRDTLPLGTFGIVVSDTRMQSKIKGWIEGVEKWSDFRASSSAG